MFESSLAAGQEERGVSDCKWQLILFEPISKLSLTENNVHPDFQEMGCFPLNSCCQKVAVCRAESGLILAGWLRIMVSDVCVSHDKAHVKVKRVGSYRIMILAVLQIYL